MPNGNVNGSYDLSLQAIGTSLADDLAQARVLYINLQNATAGQGLSYAGVEMIRKSLNLAAQICVTRKMEHEAQLSVLRKFQDTKPDDRGITHLASDFEGGGRAMVSEIGRMRVPGNERTKTVLLAYLRVADRIESGELGRARTTPPLEQAAAIKENLAGIGGTHWEEALRGTRQILSNEISKAEVLDHVIEFKNAVEAHTIVGIQQSVREKIGNLFEQCARTAKDLLAGPASRDRIAARMHSRTEVGQVAPAPAIPTPAPAEREAPPKPAAPQLQQALQLEFF